MVKTTYTCLHVPQRDTMLSHKQQSKSLWHGQCVALEAYLVPTLAVAKAPGGFRMKLL